MLLAGFALTLIIKDNYEDTIKKDFNNYYERSKSSYKKIQVDAEFYSGVT